MGKFNTNATIKTKTTEGHVAYKMAEKMKLITQVLTSFVNEKKFYGDNTDEMMETIKSVIAKDPAFVANLAVFARREFHMRSVSHVLTAYLAHEPNGKPFVRELVSAVCERGDDLTEIMSFYLSTFGKPIPNSLKKGINDKLVTLDEYVLAKYKGDGKAVKMRDLLCLCRPSPKTEAQSAMFKRCLDGTLETPYTWESELSAKSNSTATWEALIDSSKVGYMALLRNLRNILQAHPKNVEKVLRKIADPVAVSKSKQLPFRYLAAYKSVQGYATSKVFDALETAVRLSAENLPKLEGLTIIAIDTSGSMSAKISGNSEVACYEVAMMLGLIANQMCKDSIVYTFDTTLKELNSSHYDSILAKCRQAACGGGTNMSLPFARIIEKHIKPDRVIVVSDNMCNQGITWYSNQTVGQYAQKAREAVGKNFWVHAIDCLGYGTQQFNGEKTNIMAGWSEKILEFIRYAEMGEAQIQKIVENYMFLEY